MAEEKQLIPVHQSIEINCVCGKGAIIIKNGKCSGDKIYYCKQCEKSKDKNTGNKYCTKCGPVLHLLYKHSFDVNSSDAVSIRDILKTKENKEQARYGFQLLKAMIGNAKFNKLMPYLEKAPAVTTVGVSGVLLYTEVAKFVADNSVKVFKVTNALKAGGITMAIATVAELAVNGLRWYNGDISGKEWLRLSGKAIVRNAAAYGGMVAGAKIGAVLGTGLAPGVGTAIGIVAGAFLGFLCGVGAAALYEKYFPNGEQKAREDAVKTALIYFHYQEKDIKNRKIFNRKELHRRFRQFALDAHPDRRGGDQSEWNILSQHYGILKGLCQKSISDKKLVEQVLAIEM